MLLLTRKAGQGFYITREIHVTVQEFKRRSVRLQILDRGQRRVVPIVIGEAVAVRPGVSVELASVRDSRYVRLGVEAPRDMNVWRDELAEEAPDA